MSAIAIGDAWESFMGRRARDAASAALVAPPFSAVLLKFSVELLNWNGARTELCAED
jgi:hypothetical protein